MPNFIASSIKGLNLPFKKDNVEFLKVAKGRNIDFLLTKSGNEEFFIAIKEKDNKFVIKGEKLTRPAKVGLLQKALEVFKDEFCDGILSEAFAVKKNSLTQNKDIIKSEKEALEELNLAKFDEICIEVGFGSGRHLLYQARTNPNSLFLGIEIYKPAIEQVAKLAIKEGLENIILTNGDARVFLSLANSNTIFKIYLHFPVPWDDSPHRRVISAEFLKEVQRVLKKEAKFELRSDSRAYVDFSVIKFLDMDEVEISVYKNRNLEVSSKYEDRWKRQDKDIYDVILTNYQISLNLDKDNEMEFDKLNPRKIALNFKNETHKFSDFFVHFEDIYKFSDDEILLKLSFGGFDTAENRFIYICNEGSSYFINKPLKTEKNLKAHQKIGELLKQWQI
ncbi:tRNA (guanosine(46)-N7)-methyltransferase TrmB [Campylobacter geochelonis]|uniref:tRNA (guanosine(46)-N7)-methyltransferase TrmB n=1 Tax=Campylobacter geochelonis TaxID=1780362 RepID=UPI00077087A6|nr:tRNA (guanosine(46)-N7)-methyltransferase TrmB [Campylobacter geochelonis]CZE51318.1 tRNA (guanine-N(7)-)-methyltransferase [Campylobacter geochelonis]